MITENVAPLMRSLDVLQIDPLNLSKFLKGVHEPSHRRPSVRGTLQAVKNCDGMRTMYSPKIVSVEGNGKETAGQGPVIRKSEDWVADKTFHCEAVAGPFFNGATLDPFTVSFTLDVTPKSTRQRIKLEEVSVSTVNKDD
jgi:hypothetical protein